MCCWVVLSGLVFFVSVISVLMFFVYIWCRKIGFIVCVVSMSLVRVACLWVGSVERFIVMLMGVRCVIICVSVVVLIGVVFLVVVVCDGGVEVVRMVVNRMLVSLVVVCGIFGFV